MSPATRKMSPATRKLLVLCGALVLLLSPAFAQQDASSEQAQATALLNKQQFHNVTISVANGEAILSGTVDRYDYKADAEKRVHKVKGISPISNQIAVIGPSVPDAELEHKLREKVAYVAFDRTWHGDIFNAINVSVSNGVVTLGGHAHTYMDRDSAINLVSMTPGVKDVVGKIEVDPASFMDDRVRVAVARAIYGFPGFTKYAIDPVKPIRISVQSGNVALYGSVSSETDKNTAYLRANGVSGVFSVKNYLQVDNPTK